METRIEKHQKYRQELIKQGAATRKETDNKRHSATLPLNQVMDNVNNDDLKRQYYIKQRNLKITMIVVLSILLAAVVVALIFFGIYAFK